jgi:hypothetical protein
MTRTAIAALWPPGACAVGEAAAAERLRNLQSRRRVTEHVDASE